jgi:hypothetical protein
MPTPVAPSRAVVGTANPSRREAVDSAAAVGEAEVGGEAGTNLNLLRHRSKLI